jgi:transcriptional regulator with XRE-family HTH domain
LGRLLVLYRASRGIGVREMAIETSLSAATLSRIERGHAMDAATLLKLWAWLLEERTDA